MHRTLSLAALRTIGLLALVVVTAAPTTRSVEVDAAKAAPLIMAPDAAPIVVAQGRCFNGRCF